MCYLVNFIIIIIIIFIAIIIILLLLGPAAPLVAPCRPLEDKQAVASVVCCDQSGALADLARWSNDKQAIMYMIHSSCLPQPPPKKQQKKNSLTLYTSPPSLSPKRAKHVGSVCDSDSLILTSVAAASTSGRSARMTI